MKKSTNIKFQEKGVSNEGGDKHQKEYTFCYNPNNHSPLSKVILDDELYEKYDCIHIIKADSGHYEKTPYSFTPKMAKKYVPNTQIDLGQGLLDMIQEIHKIINK